jgi:glycosyltransferase involved in cell wall biosynthesis
MSKILVAIPCYNCEIQIKRVIAGFDENLLDKIEKVIIIDNQSKDDTINSAINAIKTKTIGHDKFNVFRNDNNYGLGGSHKVAFNFGFENGMDYVIILHGDDQAKTQEINNFISEIERNDELAAILGSRFMKNSKLYGYSFFRTYGNIALFPRTVLSLPK